MTKRDVATMAREGHLWSLDIHSGCRRLTEDSQKYSDEIPGDSGSAISNCDINRISSLDIKSLALLRATTLSRVAPCFPRNLARRWRRPRKLCLG
eukprot:1088318-Amorphochlora_amoeboformis.AAC.1